MNDSALSPTLPAPRKSVPGIAQSIALCAIAFSITIAIAIPLEILKLVFHLPLDMFVLFIIEQGIAWPITILIALWWGGVSFRTACPLTSFPIRIVPALLIASFGALIVLAEAMHLIPMPEFIQRFLKEQFGASSALSRFAGVVIVAPLGEELFFRGVVLRGYLGRYSFTKAAWASAALFAAFHLNPWQFVLALPLGLWYAWLFVRTRSLIPGILSHATVNFSSNFLLAPLAGLLGYNAKTLEKMDHYPLPILAIGVVTAGIGGFVLWRQLPGDGQESTGREQMPEVSDPESASEPLSPAAPPAPPL